jgi:hypothetical protein
MSDLISSSVVNSDDLLLGSLTRACRISDSSIRSRDPSPVFVSRSHRQQELIECHMSRKVIGTLFRSLSYRTLV